jgi:hypothetical protein
MILREVRVIFLLYNWSCTILRMSVQSPRILGLARRSMSIISIFEGKEIDSHLDRTSELRKKGFAGRRLGPKQMTTDTAVRVTRLIVQEKSMAKLCQLSKAANHAT